jgi:enoyl-CoA hydratase/carnithine racemase
MTLTIERDGPVTTLIRDRRAARNAMDPASAEALTDALLAFDADERQWVAVLWGAGGAFCAGFDLKYAAGLMGERRPLSALDFPHGDGAVPRGPMGPTRLALSKPVIAAVAGPAVAGGMELALWCDLRVMEESAYMGVYCRRWGVPLIDGGTVRLPRIVGRGTALDIILTARCRRRSAIASGSVSGWCRRARAARRPRRWRTSSRAFRKAACAPTAARCGCRKACRKQRACAPSGPARPPWWPRKAPPAPPVSPPARAATAILRISECEAASYVRACSNAVILRCPSEARASKDATLPCSFYALRPSRLARLRRVDAPG